MGSPNGFVLIQHLYVVLLTLCDEGKKLRRTVLCGKRNFSVYVNNIGILYRYSNEMTYMKDKPNGAVDINLIILELPLERQVVALAVVVSVGVVALERQVVALAVVVSVGVVVL